MEILLFLVSVVKVVHTMGAITLLQHKKIHPIPIDCECGSTIRGGAISCYPASVGESDPGYVRNDGTCTYNLLDMPQWGQKEPLISSVSIGISTLS